MSDLLPIETALAMMGDVHPTLGGQQLRDLLLFAIHDRQVRAKVGPRPKTMIFPLASGAILRRTKVDDLSVFSKVNSNDLQEFLKKPLIKTLENRTAGGRPAEYDWASFDIEVIRIVVHLRGLPPTQAELQKTMLEWCQSQWGKEPSVSSVRARISSIYKAVKASN